MPTDGSIRGSIDFTLKSGWSFDAKHHTFTSESGEKSALLSGLPKGSKVVYKVPRLARAKAARLSDAERTLQRHMQVILPAGAPASEYLRAVRAWPAVEKAHVSPQVSLPHAF